MKYLQQWNSWWTSSNNSYFQIGQPSPINTGSHFDEFIHLDQFIYLGQDDELWREIDVCFFKIWKFELYHSTNRSFGLYQKSYEWRNQISTFAIEPWWLSEYSPRIANDVSIIFQNGCLYWQDVVRVNGFVGIIRIVRVRETHWSVVIDYKDTACNTYLYITLTLWPNGQQRWDYCLSPAL